MPEMICGGQRAELRAGPDIGRLAVLRNLGDGVHRLHLCVIGVFGPVASFDGLRRAAQSGLHVTDLIFDLGLGVWILGLSRVVVFGLVRVEACGRGAACVPRDLERLHARARGFNGIADHRHAERKRNDLGHALHLHHVGKVHVLRLGAFHRRLEHRRVDHAWHLHIDAVFRRAVDFRRARRCGRCPCGRSA